MKWFIAHKVSGEDYEQLEEEMKQFCSKLTESGHEYYCSFLDRTMRKTESKEEKIKNAFDKIDSLDGILIMIKSDAKSEGMLLEAGYAIAKGKKFVLLIKEGATANYLRALANHVIEFNDNNDLLEKIGEIQ